MAKHADLHLAQEIHRLHALLIQQFAHHQTKTILLAVMEYANFLLMFVIVLRIQIVHQVILYAALLLMIVDQLVRKQNRVLLQ